MKKRPTHRYNTRSSKKLRDIQDESYPEELPAPPPIAATLPSPLKEEIPIAATLPSSTEEKEEEQEEEEVEEDEEEEDEEEILREQRHEFFIKEYKDYTGFMEFLAEKVCNETDDVFCTMYDLGTFNPDLFTIKAPEGYSFYTITEPSVTTSPTRFYSSIVLIHSKIPQLNPSIIPNEYGISEHSYLLYLNRLIYYYRIYDLSRKRKLNSFTDSVGLIIYTHGAYPSYNIRNKGTVLSITPPVENLFLCSKAAPGCLTADHGRFIFEDIRNPDSTLWQMTNDIYKEGFVNFDKVVFRNGPCGRISADDDDTRADCYKIDTKRGRSMEHFITPNTRSYINKEYRLTISDSKAYVINLELLNNYKDDSTIIPEEILVRCSIFDDPIMAGKLKKINEDSYSFMLSDIMDYCSRVLGKKNVFIYDRSCGGTSGTYFRNNVLVYAPLSPIIQRKKEFSAVGLGMSKRRHRKKRNSKRTKRNHKKRKTQKRMKR